MLEQTLLECHDCGKRFFSGAKRALATSWQTLKPVEVESCPKCSSLILQLTDGPMRFKDLETGMVFVLLRPKISLLLHFVYFKNDMSQTYVEIFASGEGFSEPIDPEQPIQVVDISHMDPDMVAKRIADFNLKRELSSRD